MLPGKNNVLKKKKNNVLLRPCGLKMQLTPIKPTIEIFKILVGRPGDLLILWMDAQNRPLHKFPCLLNLPSTNMEWSVSFFKLSLPSVFRGQKKFQISSRELQGWGPMILFSFYEIIMSENISFLFKLSFLPPK